MPKMTSAWRFLKKLNVRVDNRDFKRLSKCRRTINSTNLMVFSIPEMEENSIQSVDKKFWRTYLEILIFKITTLALFKRFRIELFR